MRGIICLAVMTMALTGCGPRVTERGFRAMVDSYSGQHIDNLVAAWGPPQASYTYEDGRREYSFTKSRYVSTVSPVVGFGGFYGGRWGWGGYGGFPMYRESLRQYRCETRVSTDRKGRITSINYRGNDCRALEVNKASALSTGEVCGAYGCR